MPVKVITWAVTLAILSNLFPTPLGQREYSLSNLASLLGTTKITGLKKKKKRDGRTLFKLFRAYFGPW